MLAAVREGHTIFVANTAEIMPGDFARSADFSLPVGAAEEGDPRARPATTRRISSTPPRTATALFGNSLGANMFMLGFAFQHGGLPLSAEAIEKAIELNGEAVAMNIAAFRWGRRAAHRPGFVRDLVAGGTAGGRATAGRRRWTTSIASARRLPHRLPERRLCAALRRAGRGDPRRRRPGRAPGSTAVAEAVARNLFKLMAIKDEYEVARLYTDGSFARQLAGAVPELRPARIPSRAADPRPHAAADGAPRKSSFGPWMMRASACSRR